MEVYDEFISFLDAVMFEGFAEQYAKEYPAEFTTELNQFYDSYFSG